MTLQATVSMSWVAAVLAEAERQGVPRAQLLARAAIAPEELQQQRWPIDHITRLWHAAVACTQDAGFGLKAGSRAGPGNFNVLGDLLRSSATLREAIAAVQKYQRLISDGGRFQMVAGERAGWLIYHPRQGTLAFSPHQVEAVLATVLAFVRDALGAGLGGALRPLQVQFSQPRVGPLAGYREVFACPVAFEQAFNGLLLDNALLDAPLPHADARRVRAHQREAAAHLAGLHQGGALVQELRAWMAAALASRVPARAEAARALGVSERTLARRLRLEGHSFADLLDALRRDVALQAVAQTARPLSEIGQSLGYAEPAVFWRAFRRWTGATPAQWRERGGGEVSGCS
ncbi:MAG: AraC family transcriptional regulator [Proteobacteria bacterium]|nr:AraC family transcriptional regulator [Pseudomonadota bacterium]